MSAYVTKIAGSVSVMAIGAIILLWSEYHFFGGLLVFFGALSAIEGPSE